MNVKSLVKQAGKAMACNRATGPVTRLLIRAIYKAIDNAPHWNAWLKVNKESKIEMCWWANNLREIIGRAMLISEEEHIFEVTLAGDASGAGGYLGNVTENLSLLSVPFSEEEKVTS